MDFQDHRDNAPPEGFSFEEVFRNGANNERRITLSFGRNWFLNIIKAPFIAVQEAERNTKFSTSNEEGLEDYDATREFNHSENPGLAVEERQYIAHAHGKFSHPWQMLKLTGLSLARLVTLPIYVPYKLVTSTIETRNPIIGVVMTLEGVFNTFLQTITAAAALPLSLISYVFVHKNRWSQSRIEEPSSLYSWDSDSNSILQNIGKVIFINPFIILANLVTLRYFVRFTRDHQTWTSITHRLLNNDSSPDEMSELFANPLLRIIASFLSIRNVASLILTAPTLFVMSLLKSANPVYALYDTLDFASKTIFYATASIATTPFSIGYAGLVKLGEAAAWVKNRLVGGASSEDEFNQRWIRDTNGLRIVDARTVNVEEPSISRHFRQQTAEYLGAAFRNSRQKNGCPSSSMPEYRRVSDGHTTSH